VAAPASTAKQKPDRRSARLLLVVHSRRVVSPSLDASFDANAGVAAGVIGLPVELGAGVEKYLDGNAAAIVNSRSCLSSAICTATAQADGCTVAEVAPPELALGTHDRDRECVVGLLVADGERVLSAGSPAGDADECHVSADERVQWGSQQGCDEMVAAAVP